MELFDELTKSYWNSEGILKEVPSEYCQKFQIGSYAIDEHT
jgi:hypothetical protein